MPRLTADFLLQVQGFLNALDDREADLRGQAIPSIENLAVLEDQFDHIDFGDNDIRKLDNFPLMKRLSSIYLVNNAVCRIGKGLGDN